MHRTRVEVLTVNHFGNVALAAGAAELAVRRAGSAARRTGQQPGAVVELIATPDT